MTNPTPSPSIAEPDASGDTAPPPAAGRWWKWLRAALHIVIPIGVVLLVRKEIVGLNLRQARDQLAAADAGYAWLAAASGILAVAGMGMYDVLAYPGGSGGRMRGWRRWGLGASCFAWTNFLTLGPIGGPALRLHFYRQAGMPVGEIFRGVARMYAGMFAGLATWVAVVLLPLPIGDGADGMVTRLVIVSVVAPLVAVLIGFLATRWKRLEKARAPWWRMALMGLVGVVDWGGGLAAFVLASRALGIDDPPGELARTMVLGNLVGMASLVPGGMGTADAIWLHRLASASATPDLALAVAVLFRMTFYIVPWSIGLVVLYVTFTRKSPAAAVWQRRLLAGAAAVNAGILLAGAAFPRRLDRIQRIADVLPLDVMEVSRAVAIVSAAIILFLVRGLMFGYRGAFVLCGSLLFASAAAHLLSTRDDVDGLISAGLLIMLLGSRHAFERAGRIPIGWEVTLAAALGSTLFLVLASVTSFPEVRYTHNLWVQFQGEHVEAARLLRGAGLVAGVAAVFLVRQAVRAPKEHASPGANAGVETLR